MTFKFMILMALCVVLPTHAETIYISTGQNGEITYAAQPMKGARNSVVLDIQTLSQEQRRAAQKLLRAQDKALSAHVIADINARESERHYSDQEIMSAQIELARSESKLQKGRTPLPSERRGNAGGGTRLTEAYFERLRQEELRVERAKQRLDKAYAARNALK